MYYLLKVKQDNKFHKNENDIIIKME